MKKLFLLSAMLLYMISIPTLASSETAPANEPITLINVFVVPEGKMSEAIAFWEKGAEFMEKQPGYISTALHQSILPNSKFQLINVAKWKTVEDFKKASHLLKTQSGLKPMQELGINPSLYKIIRAD